MKSTFRKTLADIRLKACVMSGKDWGLVEHIFIETITACNLRCSYCPNSIYDRGLVKNTKKMKTELFHKIIDELAELGWVGNIQPHFYGEPLLDDRIPDLIRYAKSKIKGLTIYLVSNGEKLDVDLYLKLIDAGVDRFMVTQHLPKPAKGVLDVLDYRKSNGTNGVGFEYEKFYEKKDRHFKNRGGLVKIKKETVKITKCELPNRTLGIGYAGNVILCCDDYFNVVKLGNVNEEKLIDIWNKPHYKKIRKDIARGIFNLDICKKCERTAGSSY